MVITAKFSSTCPACNHSISAGTKVEWNKGQKARHADCTAAASPPASAPRNPGEASAKQLSFLRSLCRQLERVQFDSMGGSGLTAAQEIRTAARKHGLTARECSELIAAAQQMIDDEM